ncbi:hypothetical protein C8J56DRAFT_799281, partial [Mycena floridula]
AGDRAPDAPELVGLEASELTTLFDFFSPTMHTVLVFGDLALFSNVDLIIRSRPSGCLRYSEMPVLPGHRISPLFMTKVDMHTRLTKFTLILR